MLIMINNKVIHKIRIGFKVHFLFFSLLPLLPPLFQERERKIQDYLLIRDLQITGKIRHCIYLRFKKKAKKALLK